MFKYIYISPSFPFSVNITKMARRKESSIPYIFKISISGRRDSYTDVLTYLRYRQLKNFGKLKPMYLSTFTQGKKKNPPIVMSYCNKIKLYSFKAKKLRNLISKVFKVCKHKFYYPTPKDRRLNPQ